MKALSLWQPWATLIALGVKDVETRSWSTKYRGPLAIHAAQHPIRAAEKIGSWEAWPADKPGRIHPNHDAERPARLYCNDVGITRLGTWAPLPLGAIVATCTLADVLPISTHWSAAHLAARPDQRGRSVMPRDHRIFGGDRDGLWLISSDGDRGTVDEYIEIQLPYGDFSEGRYAWLLTDIVPLTPPVPAKGRQGLWECDLPL